MAAPADSNPYVGPRPFDIEDAPRFFGRAREVRDLVSLIFAQRVVLLYAASGAGKTSLLKAGVLPSLDAESDADVLPVARVRSDRPASPGNVFVGGLVASLSEQTPDGARLVDVLAQRRRVTDRQLRVLVVDQFEELFTAYPERWQERLGLFDELREALESDPTLRIVLSIREDFVAQLDPFVLALPGGFRTRFRLERLDRVNALAAVKNPVSETGRSFAPGAAEALVTDLLRFRVESGSDGPMEVEGEFVEPVQLQVACRSLWADLPAEVTEITEEHLRLFGNVDEVLAQFYDESIRAAAAAAGLRERRLRRMVEQAFITSVGTRGTAYRTEDATGGIPNAAIDALEDRHLVRAEARAFARWYELTHDRLIAPIRESNARYFGRVRRRQTWYALGAAAVVLAAALAAALTLWTAGSEAAPGAKASPPTFVANAPALVSGGSRPRSFTVATQISVAGLRDQTLTVRFSEHDAKTGAPIFELAPVKRKAAGELTTLPLPPISLPVPRDADSFFVQVQVLDQHGTVLDQAKGDVLTVAGSGRVRVPAKPAASPALAGFDVSTSGDGTVTSTPAGIACGRRCSTNYAVGALVRLTATPGPGARFAGWREGCTADGPTCRLQVHGATQVRAAFVPLEVSPVRSRSCNRVDYGGRGPVDALIVSDLPLKGPRAAEMHAVDDAIRATIARSHWRAGRVNVGYQSCDDTSGAGGAPQLTTCKRNASAYAADRSVVAVIGTFDDRCAAAELQRLGGAAGGPVALVSPGASELCLTEATRLCRLEPTGDYRRYANFVRVVPNTADQAVALAEFARRKGLGCVGVIDDHSHYGATLARVFNMIGRSLGVVCAAGSWSPGASDYRTVMAFLKGKNVDAVFAAGEAGPGAGRMIRDKVAVLGPNAAVKLLAPASLLTKSVVREAGEKNVAGTIVGSIFSGSRAGSGSSNRAAAARYPSAQHAAAAAELVLAAVAKAGRNRGRVTNALRRATIAAGALGPLRIERGDPAPLRSAGTATPEPLGIQIAIAAGTSVRRTTVVRPLECLVRAALDATTDNAKLPPGCRP